MHYVYIIYSESCGIHYKGETENPLHRLEAHNKNLSEYTRNKGPWELVFIEEHIDRKAALKREKQIKRLNARSLAAPQDLIPIAIWTCGTIQETNSILIHCLKTNL